MPVLAEAAPSAVPALMDDANVSSQPVLDEDNAASQDCPSLPFSSQQSETSLYLFDALAPIQNYSLPYLQDVGSDVGASSTCTSFSDQLCADQLQELLLSELPVGSIHSDVESTVP